MRVAMYHPWVYLRSGIERMLAETLQRSRHDWVIYTHHHEPESTYPELRDADICELTPRVSVRRSFGPLVTAATAIARTRLPDDGARALLVSSEGLGDFVVNRADVPAAAYCHTPLKILFDPETKAALSALDRRKALALGALGPAFAVADRRMWRRYRHVFANSRETRDRIATARLAPAHGVEVLHPGVDVERFTPPRVTPPSSSTFLVAGRIMWQKNIELAVESLRIVRERGVDASLVIAGVVDEKSRPYLARLREIAAGLPVSFEVAPGDERLAELYRSCAALLFTARNEDFGIVPLEAMACGAPVVAVGIGGPRETVLHEETGWLLRPDPVEFADAMVRVVEAGDALAPMRRAARRRAAAFGWDAFVQRLDDAMEELALSGRVSRPAVPHTAGLRRLPIATTAPNRPEPAVPVR